ncbi:MAG: oxidoreductase [Hyphomicrobiales bacterium]|jgi:protein-disulfide isomerase|nr:oxidoreductase [Hyphomicrobiales bacterium]
MFEDREGWRRRSFLAFLASGAASCICGPVQAAGLVSDDGSPVRVVDASGRTRPQDFAHAQRFGAEKPDVILLEFFDYNCGFCRGAWRPMAGVLAEDAGLALHLVHFPILSPASEEAAAVQHAVFRRDGPTRAAELHGQLMTSQGRIDRERAHAACAHLQIVEPSSSQIGEARAEIAQTRRTCARLGIRFTPTFSMAEATFIGWPGPNTIKALAVEARKCGRIHCS